MSTNAISAGFTMHKAKMMSVLLAAALMCPTIFLAGCAGAEAEPAEEVYVSPYTWENLEQSEGRFRYYKDGELVSRVGIDVSSHQGPIDWTAVAADGIEFAFIRIGNRGYTEGMLYLDEQYQANIEGAKAAGIPVGVYFFSQAVSVDEALEEASFVLENLAGTELEYPIVYDQEPVNDSQGRANKLSSEQVIQNTQAFCGAIEAAGYSTMVYGNNKDIGRLDKETRSAYEIWFAEYDAAKPSGQFDFSIWQYSNNGMVAGIATGVDMNIHFLAA